MTEKELNEGFIKSLSENGYGVKPIFKNWIDPSKIDKVVERYGSTDPVLNEKLDKENKYTKVV